ncbi:protein arginine kinase activator [Pullulanibacillus pueri]|uniref:Protein-arginine kinase activator protein n=1 Tax=Pullulanibacillus pueri TaxID=1437324 RepID=A0A8J2ZXN7_9BACL|nr:UvrB/UvrC motif-containing protein [Pullulanibacillus pueri]MBM7683168.1 protein arginine kinase activator [Pullulanibacillus pueri]GGH85484.1 protein-arginine kinase activator protein [Pullulanibacillus pueri]
MECQECHIRPATLHFTKIINGNKTEVHLCEECAREKGEGFTGSNAFSIHNLLSGLLNFEQPMSDHGAEEPAQTIQCSKCGLTYGEFARIGKFGCDECYKAFNNKLNPILRKVHSGNTTHTGKIPKRIGKDISARRKLTDLKRQLHEHVEREEFEEAAKIRDVIRELENGGES